MVLVTLPAHNLFNFHVSVTMIGLHDVALSDVLPI